MSTFVKTLAGLIVLIPVLYVGSCSLVSNQRGREFSQVKKGDSETHVIAGMGQPSDREAAGDMRLAKYGAPECKAQCTQRLWYLNELSLAGEAWVVELDANGRVVHTAHIVSL